MFRASFSNAFAALLVLSLSGISTLAEAKEPGKAPNPFEVWDVHQSWDELLGLTPVLTCGTYADNATTMPSSCDVSVVKAAIDANPTKIAVVQGTSSVTPFQGSSELVSGYANIGIAHRRASGVAAAIVTAGVPYQEVIPIIASQTNVADGNQVQVYIVDRHVLDTAPKVVHPVPDGDGSPWADRDGDGVPDDLDMCPDKKGSVANSGCPNTNNSCVNVDFGAAGVGAKGVGGGGATIGTEVCITDSVSWRVEGIAGGDAQDQDYNWDFENHTMAGLKTGIVIEASDIVDVEIMAGGLWTLGESRHSDQEILGFMPGVAVEVAPGVDLHANAIIGQSSFPVPWGPDYLEHELALGASGGIRITPQKMRKKSR